MRKFLILGLLITLCIAVSPALADAVPAVSTDKADYYPWETVYISGTGFTSGATVDITVEWPAPDSGIYQVLPPAVADTAGGFSAAYPLTSGPNGAGLEGTYIVIATDSVNGQSATTTFTDAIQIDTTIILNTITTPLRAGQTGVAFSGKVSVPEGKPNVPDGKNVQLFLVGIDSPITTVVTTNGDGSFSGTFIAPSRAGGYPIKARFAGVNYGVQHWKASDSGIQNVVVIPVPSIFAPPDITKEGNTFGGYSGDIDTATASGGSIPYTFTNNAPVPLPLGTTTVTWTVTDNNGATATDTQIVTVVDTTKPTITAPADKTVEGTTANGADNVDLGWPTVSDFVDGSPTVTNDAPSAFPYGVTTVTWTVEDDSHNVATAEQTITVIDGTDPVITSEISGILGDNGWYTSDVTVTWTATDPESGVTSTSGTNPVTITTDTAGTTYTFSATSAGGTRTESVIIKRDTTPPTIIGAATSPPNTKGWFRDDVKVSFTATDGTSGIASPPPDVTITDEGKDLSAIQTVSDNAGNTASATVSGINIDRTPPTVKGSVSPEPNANRWNKEDVTVTFTAEDDLSGVASVTGPESVSAEGANQEVSGTATDEAGNTASETVIVNIDKTEPTISGAATSDPNANGWYKDSVIVAFTAGDALSGVDSVPSDVTLSGEGKDQSATGTVTDKAGNTASATVSGINIDKTGPAITYDRTPPANANGWNNVDVKVEFSATDGLSGVDSVSPKEQTFSTEGAGQSVTGTATDKAGNSATPVIVTVNIDKTKPTIAYERTPTANPNGWNNEDVTVKFFATDGLSGVDSVSPGEKIFSTEGADQSVTGTATDDAGNTASVTVDEINIDKTPPTLTLTYPAKVLLKQPVSVEWTASDAVSAIDGQSSGSVNVETNTIGTQTGSMSVQDLAGNSVSKSWSVTIEYKYIGFLQPVDPDGKSVFKWKSTVPVKFQLTDYYGNYILTAKAYMKTAKITDQVTGDDIEAVSTSAATEGNLFRYDATSNQYIFNLATKPLSVGTYLLKAELGDGQTITQQISLK